MEKITKDNAEDTDATYCIAYVVTGQILPGIFFQTLHNEVSASYVLKMVMKMELISMPRDWRSVICCSIESGGLVNLIAKPHISDPPWCTCRTKVRRGVAGVVHRIVFFLPEASW